MYKLLRRVHVELLVGDICTMHCGSDMHYRGDSVVIVRLTVLNTHSVRVEEAQ